jgi:hypothetical protein
VGAAVAGRGVGVSVGVVDAVFLGPGDDCTLDGLNKRNKLNQTGLCFVYHQQKKSTKMNRKNQQK